MTQPVQRMSCRGVDPLPPPSFAGCLARMTDEQAWADAAPAIMGKNTGMGKNAGGPGRGAGNRDAGRGAGGDAPG